MNNLLGGDDEEGLNFAQAAPTTTSAANNFVKPTEPIVSNGLFGGEDLKETAGDALKNKMNSIFDYEDSDDEAKHAAQQQMKQEEQKQ